MSWCLKALNSSDSAEEAERLFFPRIPGKDNLERFFSHNRGRGKEKEDLSALLGSY